MKLLSLARDLKRRKARERHGLFVAEGIRTVHALLDSDLPINGVLCAESDDPRLLELRRALANRQVPLQLVTEVDFASAADTEAPQGILAIAEIPRRTSEGLPERGDVLVLDAVQDPGNVGTIVRTAAALGASATLALPGTVDLWNAKVVRSAMGALFSHPVVALSWTDTAEWLERSGVPLWVAAARGVPISAALPERPSRVALVVANEGAGVSPQVAAAAALEVAIPMAAGTESLNVAVATGILLHLLRSAVP